MTLEEKVTELKGFGAKCNWDPTTNRMILSSPSILNIYSEDYRKDTFIFLKAISAVIQNYSLNLHIDFEHLSIIKSSAAVMVFAEITAMQLLTDYQDIITFTQPSNKFAKAIFSDFEFYKAIRPGTSKKVNNLLKEDCFFQSGTDPVKHAISAIMSLSRNGLHVLKPEAMIFQASILEAMSNVRHHSYPDHVDSYDKRWWQFVFFDKPNSYLHFVVYDRGMGIPESMKNISPGHYNEGEKIQHAMTLGISSKINEPGRGKGSREILKTYNENDNSSLLIYSGKGVYYKDKERNIVDVGEDSFSLKGTIIEWQIPYKAG